MKAHEALYSLSLAARRMGLASKLRTGVLSKEFKLQTETMIFKIKDNLSIDYCKQMESKERDLGILESLTSKYLASGEDHFDRRYLLLLCWNINKLNIPGKKTEKNPRTFFEYEPSPFDFFPSTKKIFRLLKKHSECKEKISAALMMIYLNNYRNASPYFISLLKQYLKSIKFSKNIGLFFNVNRAGNYGKWRCCIQDGKSFSRRMEILKIRSSYTNTKYFQDAWYFWITKKAKLSKKIILTDLPCRFFNACTDAEKVLILSRAIIQNKKSGANIDEINREHLSELFPINPNVPAQWIFDCDIKTMNQLAEASNIFQKTFSENPSILECECVDGKIKVLLHKEGK